MYESRAVNDVAGSRLKRDRSGYVSSGLIRVEYDANLFVRIETGANAFSASFPW